MSEQNSKRLGEFGLIQWIRERAKKQEHLLFGIGDDCSVQQCRPGMDLLTSTDLLIEDIHFKRQWTSLFDLGRKSAAVNISDIAAMGGRPESLYLSIGRPQSVSDTEIEEFINGFLVETEAYGAALAGGDTSASPGPLIISVTVQGAIARGDAIYRQGASYGDAIYVSGQLGDSALALELLQRGLQPDEELAKRFHTPSARVDVGRKLAERQQATAMLDISNGLLADLGHILAASGVGAEIEVARLPLSQSFRRALDEDAGLFDLVLAGGEDYELVFTSPLKDLAEQLGNEPGVTRVGTISQEPGIRIRQPDGGLYQCRRGGFDHFA